jgi:hypothetical protein
MQIEVASNGGLIVAKLRDKLIKISGINTTIGGMLNACG